MIFWRRFTPGWLIWGLGLALVLATAFLVVAEPDLPYGGWGFRGFPSAIALPIVTVGLLIVLRHRRHTVGWLLLSLGLASAVQGLLFEYGLVALYRYPDALPGTETVAWILNWYWIVVLWLVSMIMVFMPNGQLLSRRWRLFISLSVVLLIFGAILVMLKPGTLESSFPSINNPTGLDQLAPLALFLNRAVPTVYILTTMGGGALALITRYRRSQGAERQQLKWLAFAGILIIGTAPVAASNTAIGQMLFILATFSLPLATGIAILRYRLYDIDIIIRRTLVYGLLTIFLAGVYFSSVVLLQGVIQAISGQASPLAIVISTLMIAALFNPLRLRVQAFIDRRFYRAKYDAQQVLARFTQTARDEVSLEALTAELSRVVQETMQPEMTVLWFKNAEESSSYE